MGRGREIWIAASALGVVLAGLAQAAEPTRTGVAAVAQGSSLVRGGNAPVPLAIGDAVFSDQRIQTDERGRALIVMLDRSTLAVGPNSDLTIANYAFDAQTGTGELVMNAAKGLFRFVGGLLSKKRPVQIRTTTGTIGIRGAVVVVNLNGPAPRIGLLYGDQVDYTGNDGDTASMNRAGSLMEIGPDGTPTIRDATSDELAEMTAGLEGQGGTTPEVGDLAQVDPTLVELNERDPSEVLNALENTTDDDVDAFEIARDVLDQLDASPMGTGGGDT